MMDINTRHPRHRVAATAHHSSLACALLGFAVCAGALGNAALAEEPPAGVSPEEAVQLEAAIARDQAEAAPERPSPQAPPQRAPPAVQSLNPDLSLIADVAAAYFSSRAPAQTGGHDPRETGFTLQQLELSAGAAVDPYLRFDANIVFSLFGVEIEEAYATTLSMPGGLQLRAGQFLTRFGRINNTHPHSWAFVDQPFAIGRVFGGEGNRGLGVEASWLAPTPWFLEVVGSITDARGAATARSFFGADAQPIATPLDFQLTLAVKQFFELTPAWSLLAGVSGATGPNPTGYRNRTDVFGVDLFLKYRPIQDGSGTELHLQTEWLWRRIQLPADLAQDANGYAYVLWKLAPRLGLGARYELGAPALGRGGALADPLDPEWSGLRHRLSANATFWPSEFSRLRLQAGRDLLTWRPAADWSLMLAFEVVTGAHGAHVF